MSPICVRRCIFSSHPPQDCQLLLQEHRLYRCTLVVPDLLWLEFRIVGSPAPFIFPLSLTWRVSVFEYTFLLWWNSFWTIAPAIAIGLFDRIVGTWSCATIMTTGLIFISRRRHPDGTSRVVSIWTRRTLVQHEAFPCLHARRHRASTF